MYREGDWENETGDGREKRKDIVANKEFEIFDDTYVYDSEGNEGSNTGDAGIHRRSIPSRKWTKYESESPLLAEIPSLSPLSISAWSLVVHTWKTAWVCVRLGRLPRTPEQNLTPFHRGINLKFGIKKTHPRKDDSEKEGARRNSIDVKCVLYSTENDHTSNIYSPPFAAIEPFVWQYILELI